MIGPIKWTRANTMTKAQSQVGRKKKKKAIFDMMLVLQSEGNSRVSRVSRVYNSWLRVMISFHFSCPTRLEPNGSLPTSLAILKGLLTVFFMASIANLELTK